jgi:cell division protein ZapA
MRWQGAMGQVAINLNGRSFRFNCGDGEEVRLQELAAYVRSRVEDLTREFGNVGEQRLLLMAALYITDELWDARAEAATKSKPNTVTGKPPHAVAPAAKSDEPAAGSGNASS